LVVLDIKKFSFNVQGLKRTYYIDFSSGGGDLTFIVMLLEFQREVQN
jgi:hypothetical protein